MRGYNKGALFQVYPDLLSIKDITQALQIDRHSVYKLIKTGSIKAFKIGRAYRVTKRSLIQYVETMERRSDFLSKK